MGRTQVESRVETLPYSWYADPAVAAAERDRIFRRSWQYAGHTGELNGTGSMFPTQVGGLPVVVLLDRDGIITYCNPFFLELVGYEEEDDD